MIKFKQIYRNSITLQKYVGNYCSLTGAATTTAKMAKTTE